MGQMPVKSTKYYKKEIKLIETSVDLIIKFFKRP